MLVLSIIIRTVVDVPQILVIDGKGKTVISVVRVLECDFKEHGRPKERINYMTRGQILAHTF